MSNVIRKPQIGEGPIRMRPKLSSQAEREVRRDSHLRRARTCYGHLAGVAGVALMDKLVGLGWLEEDQLPASGNRVSYGLTSKGLQAMVYLGVDVTDKRVRQAGPTISPLVAWIGPNGATISAAPWAVLSQTIYPERATWDGPQGPG